MSPLTPEEMKGFERVFEKVAGSINALQDEQFKVLKAFGEKTAEALKDASDVIMLLVLMLVKKGILTKEDLEQAQKELDAKKGK